jgi:hypothetical protein
MTPWREYQEDVAAFFRSLGLEAETDVTLQGVRTSHDLDVGNCSGTGAVRAMMRPVASTARR